MSSFDNVGYGLLQTFVIITLDWAQCFIWVNETFPNPEVSWIYFVLLTFIVSFFTLNLIIAGMK